MPYTNFEICNDLGRELTHSTRFLTTLYWKQGEENSLLAYAE